MLDNANLQRLSSVEKSGKIGPTLEFLRFKEPSIMKNMAIDHLEDIPSTIKKTHLRLIEKENNQPCGDDVFKHKMDRLMNDMKSFKSSFTPSTENL